MTSDYSSSPINQPRRTDRQVEDEGWIRAFLHQAPIGQLATVFDGQPFINSNLFVYDEANDCIYMHTFRLGRTRTNIDANERVCFSVSAMGRLLPAKTALEMSVEYEGVTIFGTGQVVAASEEATGSLHLLLNKYFPHLRYGQDYEPIKAEELARTAVYRIQIESWSGKRKAVGDFPGAFMYGQPGALG